MALRDKLRERAQGFTEPGEAVQIVVPVQTGPSPWLAGAIGVLFYYWIWKPRVVAVTDRAVLVLQSSALLPFSPKKVVARYARAPLTVLKSGSVFTRVDVNGERAWVHRRFAKDLEAANAALAPSPTTAPIETNPA